MIILEPRTSVSSAMIFPLRIFRAANSELLIWFISCVLSEIIAGRGRYNENECIWITRTELSYPFQSIIGVYDVVNGSGSAMDIRSLLSPHHPREYCIVFGRSVIKEQEASFRVLRPKPVLRKIREQEAERKILLPGRPLA